MSNLLFYIGSVFGKFMSLKFLSIYLVVTYDSFAGQAYTDLAFRYGWDTVTILYEDNESMSRLKEILDKTADVLFPNTFKLNLKKLVNTTDNGYRDVYILGSHSFLNYETLANAGFLAGSEDQARHSQVWFDLSRPAGWAGQLQAEGEGEFFHF